MFQRILGISVILTMFITPTFHVAFSASEERETTEALEAQTQETATEEIDTAEEVIFYAENMDILEDKENYLLMKAEEFTEQEQYNEVKEIADYILTKLNADSDHAQDLLSLANDKITEQINLVNPQKVEF